MMLCLRIYKMGCGFDIACAVILCDNCAPLDVPYLNVHAARLLPQHGLPFPDQFACTDIAPSHKVASDSRRRNRLNPASARQVTAAPGIPFHSS